MNFSLGKLFPQKSKKRVEKDLLAKHEIHTLRNLDNFLHFLRILWSRLGYLKDKNLGSTVLIDLGITLECISLDDHGLYEDSPDPLFFSPMKLEDLRLYPIDMDDPETQDLEECA